MSASKIVVGALGTVLAMIVGGAVMHVAGDWFGPDSGISGVRVALANHEADASVHPNVEAWNEKFQALETTTQELKTAVEGLKSTQETNTQTILDKLDELKTED